MGGMSELSARVVSRYKELGIKQADVAERAGITPQRLNNYLKRGTMPDVVTLIGIARALQTTTDWLLGLSETSQTELRQTLDNVLIRAGIPEARRIAIVVTTEQALRLLATLPDEGDVALRSRLAVQAAWNQLQDSKPH